MSPNILAHEAPGAPLGDFMSTQCGTHECSQHKRGPMSTGVAHERSREKMGFADVCTPVVDHVTVRRWPPPRSINALSSYRQVSYLSPVISPIYFYHIMSSSTPTRPHSDYVVTAVVTTRKTVHTRSQFQYMNACIQSL